MEIKYEGLNKICDMLLDIKHLKQRVADLEDAAKRVTANLSSMPKGGGADREAVLTALADARDAYAQRIVAKEMEAINLENAIKSRVGNLTVRRVMYLYYIDCYTIQTIAEITGFTERHIKRLLACGRKAYEEEQ